MKLASESDLIPTLAGEGLRIARIRLLKFGSISVSEIGHDDGSVHPYSDRENLAAEFSKDGGLGLIQKLADIVKAHPNVFDFVDKAEGFSPNEVIIQGCRLLYGPMYSASVHLPKAQQKYQDMECREHFGLILSGTYFATIVSTDELFNYDNSAHEFRELFHSQVEKKTQWKAPVLGPCPMHSDIYVVGVVGTSKPINNERRFYTVGNDLYIVVSDNQIDAVINDCFWDFLQFVQGFYELALQRLELLAIDTEVENRMRSLFDVHSNLAALSTFAFSKSTKALKTLRDELSYVFKLRIDFSRNSRAYEESRRGFLESLLQRSLLSELRVILEKETVLDIQLPDELLASLQFFQSQSDARRNAQSILIASVIGGVIGGALTFAATLAQHAH